VRPGEFSIIDWGGYPKGALKPSGTFQLLDGEIYAGNRQLANASNRAIHKAFPDISPDQIHEIKPVKFGGNPTDLANKQTVSQQLHRQLNTWWKQLQRDLSK
jgi:hypothetical protein